MAIREWIDKKRAELGLKPNERLFGQPAPDEVSNDDPCHDCDGVLQCKDCSTYSLLSCPRTCKGYNCDEVCTHIMEKGDCPVEGVAE